MKNYIILLFNVISLAAVCQVKNYAITNDLGFGIYAYKVYDSNDSNILLSNKEQNWDVGYSHLLKVKPNGDTIFIKSTDAADLFVTSTGNILTHSNDYDILTQGYFTSFLTMYDRNYIKKWQLDLKDNSYYFPNTPSYTFVNGFVITSISEINNNHYIVFANYSSDSPGGPYNGKRAFNIDSLGNMSNLIFYEYNPLTFDEFINETKNKVVGLANYHSFNTFPACQIITYDLTNYSSKIMVFDTAGMMPVFKKGIFINNKMYVAGVMENRTNATQVYKKAFIACLDSNAQVNWCKTIIPNDSTINNEISDIIKVNDKLLCKYKSDTSTYILNLDTLGQMLNAYQTDARITNLVKFNNNIYTSRTKTASQSQIGLVKMDSVGNYSCAFPASLIITNYSLSVASIYNVPGLLYGTLTYSLSNQLNIAFTYTINLSDGCDIVTAISERDKENEISVWPNPTNGLVTINSQYEMKQIEVTSIAGQILLSEPTKEKTHQLQLQDFAEGIYFVKVVYTNGMSVTKKVVVNR